MWDLMRWRHDFTMLNFGVLVIALAMSVSLMGQREQEQPELLAVELDRSGGHVPTYQPHFRLDVGKLAPSERRELQRLVRESDFFAHPANIAGTAHPDSFEYHLTVQTKDGRHTVTYHDDDGHPESLDAVADWIRAHQTQ